MKKYPKTIKEILADSTNKETIEKLRNLVKNTLPNLKATVKRGNITYVLNGKDFLRILTYKTHAELGFVNGTRIASMLLKRRGKGRSWRHLEVKTPEDVDNPEIKRLLEWAAELFLLQ